MKNHNMGVLRDHLTPPCYDFTCGGLEDARHTNELMIKLNLFQLHGRGEDIAPTPSKNNILELGGDVVISLNDRSLTHPDIPNRNMLFTPLFIYYVYSEHLYI